QKAIEKRARKLRKHLTRSAAVLVETGTLQRSELDHLCGKKDAGSVASDCVKLAIMLRPHAAVMQGNLTELDEAALLGTDFGHPSGPELSGTVSPTRDGNGAPGSTSPREMRDRLWTLLCIRHDRLWRVGAYLFGRKLADRRVPPLGSPVKKEKKKKKEMA